MINHWKSLTPGQQLVFALIVAVAAYYALKIVKGSFGGITSLIGSIGEQAGIEQATGAQASFTTSQYAGFADELENAMAGPGTEEDIIFGVFYKMNNDIDILRLDQAFGMRSTFWTSPANLQGWLQDDLSSSELAQLNSILVNKGITRRF